ncbi:hypothetical protein JX266_007712 [Neoarthrinium moseri]|nr:hypothetical protein JX266_007712 [Neoarthrinium moseri]
MVSSSFLNILTALLAAAPLVAAQTNVSPPGPTTGSFVAEQVIAEDAIAPAAPTQIGVGRYGARAQVVRREDAHPGPLEGW